MGGGRVGAGLPYSHPRPALSPRPRPPAQLCRVDAVVGGVGGRVGGDPRGAPDGVGVEPRPAHGASPLHRHQVRLARCGEVGALLRPGPRSLPLPPAARALGAARPPLAADERGGLGLCSRRTCRCWWTFADSA